MGIGRVHSGAFRRVHSPCVVEKIFSPHSGQRNTGASGDVKMAIARANTDLLTMRKGEAATLFCGVMFCLSFLLCNGV